MHDFPFVHEATWREAAVEFQPYTVLDLFNFQTRDARKVLTKKYAFFVDVIVPWEMGMVMDSSVFTESYKKTHYQSLTDLRAKVVIRQRYVPQMNIVELLTAMREGNALFEWNEMNFIEFHQDRLKQI